MSQCAPPLGGASCVATAGRARSASHEFVVATSSPAWQIESLEMATHRGRSTGLLDAVVLPGSSDQYSRPSVFWTPFVWLLLTGLFLLPASDAPRALRYVGRAFAIATAAVFAATLMAPLVSRYLIVISVRTFVVWLLLAVLPRSMGRTLWRASPRRDRRLVWAIAMAVVLFGIVHGRRAVGGADEYGYVSEADLWLKTELKVPQPFIAEVPWSRAAWTFSPLGYRPSPRDDRFLVPVYSPGLPIVLAVAKALGGQTMMFLVVPLFGGLLVLSTYGIGRRLESSAVGLIGAWLVATSPVVVWMTVAPMTDVPVAAVWAAAFYFVLAPTTRSAAIAGLLSGLAVLIRPNLVPLAAVLGSVYLLRMRERQLRATAIRSTLVFGAAAIPGILAIAALNSYLYGSPLASGYGQLGQLFEWEHVGTNLRLYLGWLVQAHTPFVLLGLVTMFVPLRRFWRETADRAPVVVMAVFVMVAWMVYCAWGVFDSWLFCRFLLCSWPFIMLGVGAAAMAFTRLRTAVLTPLVVVGVLAVGGFQLQFAKDHGAFAAGSDGLRDWAAARVVSLSTEPNSVVVSYNHSGSIRYYGGRMTMNTMYMGGSLDEIVEWLSAHHVHVYAALEDWELPGFQEQFDGAECLAALDHPIAVFEEPGKFEVFDLSDPGRVTKPIVVTGFTAQWSAPRPEPLPPLVLN